MTERPATIWRFRPEPGPPEGVRAYYNRIYDGDGHGESDRFYDWLLDAIAPATGERIVDVACGAGGLLGRAARRGLRPVGVDVAERALDRARAALPAASLVQAYGEALPLANGAFRYVASLGSLEHYLDPLAGVRELVRVLAPGGTCAVMVPNSFYSGDIWRVIRTGRGPDHHQDPQRFATRSEWAALLEAGGLRVRRVLRHDKFKWWKSLLPFNLAYCFVYLAGRADASEGGGS